MKLRQAFNVVVASLASIYLIWMQIAEGPNNPNVMLPFAFGLPPTVLIVIALGFGYGWAWLNDRAEIRAKKREIRLLEKRLAELEQRLPSYDGDRSRRTPVIPDRTETKAIPTKRSVITEYEDL